MFSISTTREGIVLGVKAAPSARKTAIRGEHAGLLKVSVQQPPENGKANEAVLALVARELGLAKSQVVLAAGATSKEKKLLITGIDEPTLRSRLQACVAAAAEKGGQK